MDSITTIIIFSITISVCAINTFCAVSQHSFYYFLWIQMSFAAVYVQAWYNVNVSSLNRTLCPWNNYDILLLLSVNLLAFNKGEFYYCKFKLANSRRVFNTLAWKIPKPSMSYQAKTNVLVILTASHFNYETSHSWTTYFIIFVWNLVKM